MPPLSVFIFVALCAPFLFDGAAGASTPLEGLDRQRALCASLSIAHRSAADRLASLAKSLESASGGAMAQADEARRAEVIAVHQLRRNDATEAIGRTDDDDNDESEDDILVQADPGAKRSGGAQRNGPTDDYERASRSTATRTRGGREEEESQKGKGLPGDMGNNGIDVLLSLSPTVESVSLASGDISVHREELRKLEAREKDLVRKVEALRLEEGNNDAKGEEFPPQRGLGTDPTEYGDEHRPRGTWEKEERRIAEGNKNLREKVEKLKSREASLTLSIRDRRRSLSNAISHSEGSARRSAFEGERAEEFEAERGEWETKADHHKDAVSDNNSNNANGRAAPVSESESGVSESEKAAAEKQRAERRIRLELAGLAEHRKGLLRRIEEAETRFEHEARVAHDDARALREGTLKQEGEYSQRHSDKFAARIAAEREKAVLQIAGVYDDPKAKKSDHPSAAKGKNDDRFSSEMNRQKIVNADVARRAATDEVIEDDDTILETDVANRKLELAHGSDRRRMDVTQAEIYSMRRILAKVDERIGVLRSSLASLGDTHADAGVRDSILNDKGFKRVEDDEGVTVEVVKDEGAGHGDNALERGEASDSARRRDSSLSHSLDLSQEYSSGLDSARHLRDEITDLEMERNRVRAELRSATRDLEAGNLEEEKKIISSDFKSDSNSLSSGDKTKSSGSGGSEVSRAEALIRSMEEDGGGDAEHRAFRGQGGSFNLHETHGHGTSKGLAAAELELGKVRSDISNLRRVIHADVDKEIVASDMAATSLVKDEKNRLPRNDIHLKNKGHHHHRETHPNTDQQYIDPTVEGDVLRIESMLREGRYNAKQLKEEAESLWKRVRVERAEAARMDVCAQ